MLHPQTYYRQSPKSHPSPPLPPGPSSVALGHTMYPPGPVSNKSVPQSPLVVHFEVYPVITVRTMRARGPGGGMSRELPAGSVYAVRIPNEGVPSGGSDLQSITALF